MASALAAGAQAAEVVTRDDDNGTYTATYSVTARGDYEVLSLTMCPQGCIFSAICCQLLVYPAFVHIATILTSIRMELFGVMLPAAQLRQQLTCLLWVIIPKKATHPGRGQEMECTQTSHSSVRRPKC